MYFSESYTLMLKTDATNSAQAPAIRLTLQCTSEDQDYYGGIMLDVINPDNIPVETVFGMFGPSEGEYHPGRVTGNNLDISPSWEWYYYEPEDYDEPWPLSGSLDNEPDTLALISDSLTGSWLRIEVFGFVYDFDLSMVHSTITGYHQKCVIVHEG